MVKEVKSKIVAAVGTAGGGAKNAINAQELTDAMQAAVMKCFEEGITDPEKVREAQLKAREDYKAKKEAEAFSA